MSLEGAQSAETKWLCSKAPDTWENRGLLHKKRQKNKKEKKRYFLQTHILKQTLLLRASKAGGWMAGNGGWQSRTRSIYFDNSRDKKSHATQVLKGFFLCVTIILFWYFSGEPRWNQEKDISTCFYFCFVFVRYATFTSLSFVWYFQALNLPFCTWFFELPCF